MAGRAEGEAFAASSPSQPAAKVAASGATI
jgi:hypothetical protein